MLAFCVTTREPNPEIPRITNELVLLPEANKLYVITSDPGSKGSLILIIVVSEPVAPKKLPETKYCTPSDNCTVAV